MADQFDLILLKDTFAISRLAPESSMPNWAKGEFASVTWTAEEVSIVCPESVVPEGIRCDKGWKCLRVAGTLDFSLVGVLASIVGPLAKAGVSVFCVSTFDTDYVLLKEADLQKGICTLEQCGHRMLAAFAQDLNASDNIGNASD